MAGSLGDYRTLTQTPDPSYRGLTPDMVQRISDLQAALATHGIDAQVGSGFRDPEVQARLYAQGRTTPGPIVTGAPAGSSYHNYGLAADLITDKKGSDVEKLVGALAPQYGLKWGGTFSNIYDPYHVQMADVSIGSLRNGTSGVQVATGPGPTQIAGTPGQPPAPAQPGVGQIDPQTLQAAGWQPNDVPSGLLAALSGPQQPAVDTKRQAAAQQAEQERRKALFTAPLATLYG